MPSAACGRRCGATAASPENSSGRLPVGRHIPDFVSFVHRIAIELVNANELEAIVADRAARRNWLAERDYRVIEMAVGDVEADLDRELARLERTVSERK